jgi:hypothetical protein
MIKRPRVLKETTMSNLVSRLKKAAVLGLAITTFGTGVMALSTTEAEAQWRHRNRGAAVAAGIIGGIAAGALIAGAARAHSAPAYGHGYGYAQPSYGYGYAQPTYSYAQPSYGHGYYQPAYESGYVYQPRCYTRKVRQVIDYDTVVIRRVRQCH